MNSLSDFISFLTDILVIIEYSSRTLEDIIRSSNRKFGIELKCLLDAGESLSDAWCSATKVFFYQNDDRSTAESFFVEFGRTDAVSQAEKIRSYINMCERLLHESESELKNKGRVAVSLCSFGALTAALVLI